MYVDKLYNDIVPKITKAELMRYPILTLHFQDMGMLPILAECSCKANAAQRASQKLKVKNAHSVHISEM